MNPSPLASAVAVGHEFVPPMWMCCAWGESADVPDICRLTVTWLPSTDTVALPLALETKQNTVPYVYLRGVFIGGFNALSEIERLGQLEVALMSAEERANAPAHLKSIEIVARPNTDEVAPAETDASAE